MALALAKNPALAAEVEEDREVTEIAKEEIDGPQAKPKPADGKLVVAEEVAVGHVTWRSVKLLLSSLGGDHTILFFTFVMAAFVLNEWSITFQTWFLGYWGSQYETHLPSEVNVSLWVALTSFWCKYLINHSKLSDSLHLSSYGYVLALCCYLHIL